MEKKTTKKRKPSPSKTISEFEKRLGALPASEKIVIIPFDGENYELHIKSYLDFETKAGLMSHVRRMYFNDGFFDRQYGDAVLELVLFQLYTGLTFGGDISLFDAFIHSDYAMTSTEFREAYYSEDYYEIRNAIESTLDVITKEAELPLYQELFYKNCNDLIDLVRALLENASDSLNEMASSFQSNNGSSVRELLEALQNMNQKDEKKLVNAILDFQEAKAKRTAIPVK